MGWCGPMTHRQYVVWMAWMRQKYAPEETTPDTSFVVGRDVDAVTWARWSDKVGSGKYAVASGAADRGAR